MRVVLHIGQHKTGSKALQSALYANRDWLAARGFWYPVAAGSAGPLRPYEMNHHDLFEAVRAEVQAGSGDTQAPTVKDWLRTIVDPVPAKANTVILSAEDLFDMHTAHEEAFEADRVATGAQLLARALADCGASVTVVAYLRRQDHLLAAHYAQFIKGSNRASPTFKAFARGFAPRLDTDSILADWESAFGIGAITVVPYEPAAMAGGIVPDFFARVLGLEPPPACVPFPKDLEAFNITPPRDWLEFMRLLNRRSSRGLPVFPRGHVLEAAFRDRGTQPTGVAAWLSPGERADLLTRYEPGNRQIAERYRLGASLFQEPLPHERDPWVPPRPLLLERLVELDAHVRSLATANQRPKRMFWVISPHALPHDEARAADLFGSVAGHPDLEHRIVSHITPRMVLVRPTVVVLIGPPQNCWDRFYLEVLRWSGTRVVFTRGTTRDSTLLGDMLRS